MHGGAPIFVPVVTSPMGNGYPVTERSKLNVTAGSPSLEGGLVSKKVHITVSISAEAFAAAARN